MLITPNLKSVNAFLRSIMQEFEVKTARSYSQSLANLSEVLQIRVNGGMSAILLIDEAQNLPTDVVRLIHFLLNQETNSQKLPQIALFGQTEPALKIERFPELRIRMFPSAPASLSREDTSADRNPASHSDANRNAETRSRSPQRRSNSAQRVSTIDACRRRVMGVPHTTPFVLRDRRGNQYAGLATDGVMGQEVGLCL